MGKTFSLAELNGFYSSIGGLGKKITRESAGIGDNALVQKFFQSLPEVMAMFRANVATDIETGRGIENLDSQGNKVTAKVNLKQRLPQAYLSAYSKID